MLFFTLFVLVPVGLTNAQLPDIPKCSLNCFVNALTTDGCSTLTDFACHCQKPALISTVTPCVEKSCEVPDQIAVSKAVVSQCSAIGHPISVPAIETTTSASSGTTTTTTTETCSSTSKTGTSTSATSTSTGSSTISSCTSTVESTMNTTSAMPSSSMPPGSSSAGGSSSVPTKTSTPLPSKTHGGSNGPETSTFNAAGSVKGNMAGVAVIAAAAAYIL